MKLVNPSSNHNRTDRVNDSRAAMQLARKGALDTCMNRHKRRTEGKKLGLRGTPTADAIRDKHFEKKRAEAAEAQQRKAAQEEDAKAKLREEAVREDEAYFKKHGFYPVRKH